MIILLIYFISLFLAFLSFKIKISQKDIKNFEDEFDFDSLTITEKILLCVIPILNTLIGIKLIAVLTKFLIKELANKLNNSTFLINLFK